MNGNLINILRLETPSAEASKNVTFLNPYSYVIARKNIELFSQFDQIHCDGVVLSMLLRLIGIRKERKSFDMTSMAHNTFIEACQHDSSIYFIGSEPGVAENAVQKIKDKYHGLRVVGVRHGFFEGNSDRRLVLREMIYNNPDIIIVGMGSPFQEKLLVDLRKNGWNGTGYTCGGFLHQTAKAGLNYYPKWINYFNLRWAYRIYDEPKLLKRYLIYYPAFVVLFFFDALVFKSNFKSKSQPRSLN